MNCVIKKTLQIALFAVGCIFASVMFLWAALIFYIVFLTFVFV